MAKRKSSEGIGMSKSPGSALKTDHHSVCTTPKSASPQKNTLASTGKFHGNTPGTTPSKKKNPVFNSEDTDKKQQSPISNQNKAKRKSIAVMETNAKTYTSMNKLKSNTPGSTPNKKKGALSNSEDGDKKQQTPVSKQNKANRKSIGVIETGALAKYTPQGKSMKRKSIAICETSNEKENLRAKEIQKKQENILSARHRLSSSSGNANKGKTSKQGNEKKSPVFKEMDWPDEDDSEEGDSEEDDTDDDDDDDVSEEELDDEEGNESDTEDGLSDEEVGMEAGREEELGGESGSGEELDEVSGSEEYGSEEEVSEEQSNSEESEDDEPAPKKPLKGKQQKEQKVPNSQADKSKMNSSAEKKQPKPEKINKDTKSETLNANEKPTSSKHEKRAIRKMIKENKDRTIFIGNLPKDLTVIKVKKMFSKFGPILSARIRGVPVKDPKIPKRLAAIKKEFHPDIKSVNAYVVFQNGDAIQRALTANNSEIGGHTIRVDTITAKTSPDNKKAIFIGNLPFGANEDELRPIFKNCGPIESIRIVRDFARRIGKGFAFINFESSGAVELALLKDGTVLNKRPLRVQRCSTHPGKGAKRQKSASKKGTEKQNGKENGKKSKPFKGKKRDTSFQGKMVAGQGKVNKPKKEKMSPKKKAAVETLVKSLSGSAKKKFSK